MKMFLNYDILNKMENIGEDRVRAEIENIVADIISQYYEIARYSKILQFLKEQVEISRYRLQVARANFESGLGSELEVNRAEVDLNFDNSDYENITASYLNAKTKLNSILSRDIKEAFITNDSIPSVTALNYEDLKQDFLNQNKELKQIRQRRDLNYVYIKDVLGNQYPSLSFHAGYNYMNTETEAALANRSKIYGLSFGLTGNYNLFNGSNDQREYENARMEAAGYDIRVLQEENDFESQLAIVFDQFETASKLIDAETRNCSLAIRNMEIAKDSYSLGSISSLDLRELQKNLLQANERLLDSRYRAKILETQLLFLSGRIIK
jgi:outer membrane protein TolC